MKMWKGSDTVVVMMVFGLLMCVGVINHALTRIEVPMRTGIGAFAPVPECGWFPVLVCTEMSDGERECHWDKTWRCGYALSWPKTIVRRPFAEEVIKERYP